jgi:hypothetical protein
MVFLSTLLAAISFFFVEGWGFGDSLWFCFTTVLTIGYGDLTPKTHVGRGVVFAYAFVGLSWLSMCCGAIHNYCNKTLFARTRVHNVDTARVDGLLLSSPLALIVVGGVLFASMEGWSIGDSIYFCIVSLTTVGYGDFVPRSAGGKGLLVVYVLFGVPLLAIALAKIATVRLVVVGANRAIHGGCTMMAVTIVVPALLLVTAMSALEGWSFSDACYFVVVTSLTIGLGDIVPLTAAGKATTSVYILANCTWLFCLLGQLSAQRTIVIAVGAMGDVQMSTLEMRGGRRDSSNRLAQGMEGGADSPELGSSAFTHII